VGWGLEDGEAELRASVYNFLLRAGFPVTRVHLTASISLLKNHLLVALLQTLSDLDPRSPISFRASLVMLPYPQSLMGPAAKFP
jgi:hypothetical protein